MTRKKYNKPKPSKPSYVEGRRPDFKVWATQAGDGTFKMRGVVGAAWDNGTELTIKLNPFVVLTGDMVIRLYAIQPDESLNGVEVSMSGEDLPF